MNIEPCVRFGIRISPKISENPADNRNNRPPNVTLLTVSSSQNVMSADLRCSGCCCCCYRSIFTTLVSTLRQRRILPRIDRMGEELLFRPGPELADILVGLDGLVPELEPVFGVLGLNTADIEIADHIVEVIDFERAARRL